jgi:hypothetical protein
MNQCLKIRENKKSFMGTSGEGTSGPFRDVFERPERNFVPHNTALNR